MEKLKAGVKFPEVAAQYSEDKARQGVSKILVPAIESLHSWVVAIIAESQLFATWCQCEK